MQPWAWVLLIVVLVVVVLVAVAAMRRRRTEDLRNRFGPEYERAVETSDDRRGAEHDLLDRARKRDRLDIRPLPEAARARYAEQWRGIQERFIDDPAGSVGAAHTLLDQVMSERGYPTSDFEEQADLVSVDHPHVVENYRAAYAVYTRQRDGQATTEDLRDALVRYRSLFEELLHTDGTDTTVRDDRTDVRDVRNDRTDVRDVHDDRTDVRDGGARDEVVDVRNDRARDEVIDVRDETVDGRDDVPRHRADADEPMTYREPR
jgi:hypothetical protein